ncbi:type III pantothenate kinase [Thermatribacter velox]|jgi:type III pantothenate kinase|uniref:Type III pantothenate kinase n=1 Tax=Thermatribacter velox TaxID=3039681 RepID=A0ABZ2Y9W9_9BACT|nr:type pantothenate kinase [Candidatus Atribacteria bacterium]
MLLCIDVGNTHTNFGVFEAGRLLCSFRVSTSIRRTEDEWYLLFWNLLENSGIEFNAIRRVAISCVVPPVLNVLDLLFVKKNGLSVLKVSPGVKTGLAIKAEAREVGADRVVNAVAASHLYGGDLIVIDFGTATTFCAITRKREYLGGVIAPGIGMAREALYEKTAKLPKVDIEVPEHCIGRNTVEAMHAGIFFGYIGLSREIVRRMKEEFSQEARVIATGGWGIFLHRYCDFVDVFNPVLTLEGLRIIDELNT